MYNVHLSYNLYVLYTLCVIHSIQTDNLIVLSKDFTMS